MTDMGLLETLKQKLANYATGQPSTALYLHTDKTIYAPGETLWFKAYVLSGTVTDNKVIYVRLVDENRKLIINDQFGMNKLTGNGELILPDSLREGNYTLFAYTDRMINFSDQDVFTQPIHVIKSIKGGMVAQATVVDTAKLKPGEEVNINVKVNIGNDAVTDAKGAYRLYVDGKFLKGGKLATNSTGETQINFIYPHLIPGQRLSLNVNFNRNDDRTELNLNLNSQENQVILNAYAEGGHLIAGVNTKLAIRATDINHNPVSAIVILKKGAQEIKSVQTNSNGIGIISLIPEAGNLYTLKVAGNGESKLNNFPKIENKGVSLKVSLQNDKELHAIIYNKGYTGNALLVLRNHESVLWSQAINLATNDSVSVLLPGSELPKDVLNVALFDRDGNFKAERFFLNKQSKKENYDLDIRTNEQIYGTRKKVTVTLAATDRTGKPVQANLSTSVVTSGRIDIDNYRNIIQAYKYRFLKADKTNQIITESNENNIDDILITANWQSVGWNQVVAYKQKGLPKLIDNTDGIKGTILPLGTNISLTGWQLLGGSEKFNIAIDAKGVFNIPSNALFTTRDKELQWAGGTKFRESYQIKYNNEDVAFDNKILTGSILNDPEMFNTITTIQTKTGPSKTNFNDIHELGEVKIKNRVTSVGDFWSANCDDYVCENDILNCPLHPPGSAGNHKPEQGKTYAVIDMESKVNRHVIYRGCENIWYPDMIKKIYIPITFTLPDYDKDFPVEPQLMSTVYWNPNINTDQNGKASFSFFTSDIKGDYRIMVQGVKAGKTDPIYGTTKFTVK
ncbi:hypothetical protein [Mucilaginibacter sp.]